MATLTVPKITDGLLTLPKPPTKNMTHVLLGQAVVVVVVDDFKLQTFAALPCMHACFSLPLSLSLIKLPKKSIKAARKEKKEVGEVHLLLLLLRG
jgi:hypothetical protein